MKKCIAGVLALIMVVSLVGCSSEPKISNRFKDDEALLESVFETMDDFLNGPASADDTADKLDAMVDKFSNTTLKTMVSLLSSNLTLYAISERGHDRTPEVYTSEDVKEQFDDIKESVQSLKDMVYE